MQWAKTGGDEKEYSISASELRKWKELSGPDKRAVCCEVVRLIMLRAHAHQGVVESTMFGDISKTKANGITTR